MNIKSSNPIPHNMFDLKVGVYGMDDYDLVITWTTLELILMS